MPNTEQAMITANGLELLFLLDGGLTYRRVPIVGWKLGSGDPEPVVLGVKPSTGIKAVRYPDGRVYDLVGCVYYISTKSWLAVHRRETERFLNLIMQKPRKKFMPEALKRFEPRLRHER